MNKAPDQTVSHRCWVFGDNIDTDALAPGQYIKGSIETLASHSLESINPQFAQQVSTGDIIVAGRNFGMGSSREQAAQALLVLGVRAIIAQSFGGIFFRNAINLGLPAYTPVNDQSTQSMASDGDQVSFDLDTASFTNVTTNNSTGLKPLPEFLTDMLRQGGLVKVLENRFIGE